MAVMQELLYQEHPWKDTLEIKQYGYWGERS